MGVHTNVDTELLMFSRTCLQMAHEISPNMLLTQGGANQS